MGALSAGVLVLRLAFRLGFMALSVAMLLVILLAAYPPEFNQETVEEDRKRIWREQNGAIGWSQFLRIVEGIPDVVSEGENVVDSVLCEMSDRLCRYLDVSTKELARMPNRELQSRTRQQRVGTTEDEDGIDRFHTDVLDLNSRNLRFAKLGGAWLHGASFTEADLRGADLEGVNLQGASFVKTELRGAVLEGARMQNAVLVGAKLPGTNVKYADLRGARLSSAEMQGVNLFATDLRGARIVVTQLQGANLASADLQGTKLNSTHLQGANLQGADLRGADLEHADLQGANLQGADLRGADLENTDLQGADLAGTRLQGADLANVQLQGSFGKPESRYLVWMPDVSFEFPPVDFSDSVSQYERAIDGSQYERAMGYLENIENEDSDTRLAWREGMSLGKHLQEYLQIGITHKVFDGREPEEKEMVYHDSAVTEWRSPAVDVDSCDYWCAWAAWTAEFACEGPHTAASSMDRWSSEEPLYNAKSRLKHRLPGLKKSVREALIERKKDEECLGLAAIEKEDWMRFFAERNKPLRSLSPRVANCTNASTSSSPDSANSCSPARQSDKSIVRDSPCCASASPDSDAMRSTRSICR